jgi:hypothetical protein
MNVAAELKLPSAGLPKDAEALVASGLATTGPWVMLPGKDVSNERCGTCSPSGFVDIGACTIRLSIISAELLLLVVTPTSWPELWVALIGLRRIWKGACSFSEYGGGCPPDGRASSRR